MQLGDDLQQPIVDYSVALTLGPDVGEGFNCLWLQFTGGPRSPALGLRFKIIFILTSRNYCG